MTHKETVTRNIGFTFDFVNYLLDNESEIDKLPDDFKLEFKAKDFPKLDRKCAECATMPQQDKKYARVRNTLELV